MSGVCEPVQPIIELQVQLKDPVSKNNVENDQEKLLISTSGFHKRVHPYACTQTHTERHRHTHKDTHVYTHKYKEERSETEKLRS